MIERLFDGSTHRTIVGPIGRRHSRCAPDHYASMTFAIACRDDLFRNTFYLSTEARLD